MKKIGFIFFLCIGMYFNAYAVKNEKTYKANEVCKGEASFACWVSGYGYETGEDGKKKDLVTAMILYQASCKNGTIQACNSAGSLYRDEFHDDFKAVEFYKIACDLKDGNGCSNLGIMYLSGRGVKQNSTTASELFGKGCDLKSELGCKGYRDLNALK